MRSTDAADSRALLSAVERTTPVGGLLARAVGLANVRAAIVRAHVAKPSADTRAKLAAVIDRERTLYTEAARLLDESARILRND